MRIFLLLNSLFPCLSLTLQAAAPTHWPEDHTGSTWYPGIMCERFGECDDYNDSSSDTEDSRTDTPEIVRPEDNEEN